MLNTQKMICEAYGFKSTLELDLSVYRIKITRLKFDELSIDNLNKLLNSKNRNLKKFEWSNLLTFKQVLYRQEELEIKEGMVLDDKDEGIKSIDIININSKEIDLTAKEINTILLAYEQKRDFIELYEYEIRHLFNSSETKKLKIVNNNELPCTLCGNVHPKGYVADNEEELIKSLVPDTYNECYSLKPNNFMCEYCVYSLKAYSSPNKTIFGKKMINSLICNNRVIAKNFNSDSTNELYDILKNPPKPPFIILINSRGTVLENLVFTAKATISKELIIVNYGLNSLEINPNEVFNAIEEAKKIANTYGIEINSDSIWNRADDVSIQIKIKGKKGLTDFNSFYKDMSLFIEKYNRDCRIVTKMILEAYLKFRTTDIFKE